MKKVFLFGVLLFAGVSVALLAKLVLQLQNQLDTSLQKGWFTPPLEFWTSEEKLQVGMALSLTDVTQKLKQRYIPFKISTPPPNLLKLQTNAQIQSGASTHHDSTLFKQNPSSSIANSDIPLLNSKLVPKKANMLTWSVLKAGEATKTATGVTLNSAMGRQGEKDLFTVIFEQGKIKSLIKNHKLVDVIVLKPFLFAQYEQGEPVLKSWTPLEQIPFHCRMAALAAEDHNFISHSGISLKAILRAMYKNIRAGRLKEGASTITQQLVKNLFFDSKKSFSRKFKEQIMALLLEVRHQQQNKDQILSAYLNTIYMGQNGMFRVHGFRAAAKLYIGKPLANLNLSECALLAGIIKSPGRYRPSPKNQKIKQRRNHIIDTLFHKQEEWMLSISEKEWQEAKAWPINTPHKLPSPPPYWTDTVYRKIKQEKWPIHKGLRVWTTLYPDFQEQARRSVKQGLKQLENTHKHLKKNTKSGEDQPPTGVLQSALVSVELSTGALRAVVGGRDFKQSQFNRAIQAKRQIGSLMKPLVLLSALNKDTALNPLSLVQDSPWVYKYGSQVWKPKNYKNRYLGEVPLYKLLTHSLNTGTARIGVKAGLDNIAQMVTDLGGPGDIEQNPSLILGALEASPLTVAKMFLTIANMGQLKQPYIVQKVTDLNNRPIYQKAVREEQDMLNPQKVAVLVGMLQQVTKTGTARRLKNWPSFVAGKTGTTNEERDAWFVGWTPSYLTVVWVGFDDNRSHYLTGASGALPIWASFMKKLKPLPLKQQWDWPQGVETKLVPKGESATTAESAGPVSAKESATAKESDTLEVVEQKNIWLVFEKQP